MNITFKKKEEKKLPFKVKALQHSLILAGLTLFCVNRVAAIYKLLHNNEKNKSLL